LLVTTVSAPVTERRGDLLVAYRIRRTFAITRLGAWDAASPISWSRHFPQARTHACKSLGLL